MYTKIKPSGVDSVGTPLWSLIKSSPPDVINIARNMNCTKRGNRKASDCINWKRIVLELYLLERINALQNLLTMLNKYFFSSSMFILLISSSVIEAISFCWANARS
ncbi:hypothetical protein ACFX10_030985 [Malus domestica]